VSRGNTSRESKDRQLLELLMERKRKLFPNDDRMLMKVEAFEGENGLDVMVIWGRYAKVQ